MVSCRKTISLQTTRRSKKKLEYLNTRLVTIEDLSLPENVKKYFKNSLYRLIDPQENYYKNLKEKLLSKPIRVAAIFNTDLNYEKNKIVYDPVLEGFTTGSAGILSSWEKEKNNKIPMVIRGLSSSSQTAIKHCQENNIDYYCIDTGYIQPSSRKDYHRITKNGLQNLGPIIDRPSDRLETLGWKYRKPNKGSKILVCPPSEKVMKFYNLDLDQWMKETLEEIKLHSNLPVEVRLKPSRSERVTTNTIWNALEDAYCLITFNSIAATEALLYSVPAIALAPNAASVLCNTAISEIKKLHVPTKEELKNFAAHLSYCQFTVKEMSTGYAWRVLNEDH